MPKTKENKFIEGDIDARWGLVTDDDLNERAVYGTRAIIERGYGKHDDGKYRLVFVPGRTSVKGYSSDLDKMEKFLNSAKTKNAIRKFADKVGSKSKSVMTLESPGGFVLSATPNESYGYMYIKMVWKKDVA